MEQGKRDSATTATGFEARGNTDLKLEGEWKVNELTIVHKQVKNKQLLYW